MGNRFVSLQQILSEVDKTIEAGPTRTSHERARFFYESGELGRLIGDFLESNKMTKAQFARLINVSPSTVASFISQTSFSENMLFRLQNGVHRALSHPGSNPPMDGFQGDWRSTSSKEIGQAIQEVTERLVFLKKVLQTSNSLNSPDSPLDEIHIKQLIALISSFLEAVKAPYVERHQSTGLFKWIKSVARKASKKVLDKVVEKAFEEAIGAGEDFINDLSQGAPVDSLNDI